MPEPVLMQMQTFREELLSLLSLQKLIHLLIANFLGTGKRWAETGGF
jgi:hypothetical protein